MSIQFTATDPSMKQAEAFMPKEIITYVKGAKSRAEMSTPMGTTIVLTDTVKKEAFVCMDMMGNKIAMHVPFDDMSGEMEGESKPKMDIKYTSETKKIAGYNCKKAIVSTTIEGHEIVQNFWYTEEIQNTNHEYSELKGMPMEYDMNTEGMSLKYTVTNVSKETIADSVFELPEGYTVTTQEDLMKSFPVIEEED